MKRILYILCASFILAGCQNEEVTDGNGFLSISAVECDIQPETVISSRAVDETLTVDLWKGESKVRTLTAEEMNDKIELEPADDYSLKIYSANYGSDKDWTNENKGEPIYYLEKPFIVKDGTTTGLDLKVPMVTFAVRLDVSNIVDAPWLKDYSFAVSSGDRSVVLRDGETAYFLHTEGVNFSYNITITNIDDEKKELGNVWGDSEGEVVNINTEYAILYNIELNSLILN